MQHRGVRIGLMLALTCVLGAWIGVTPRAEPRALPGWPLYDRYCLACHGAAGDGRGPAAAFTWGQPRAFLRGEYFWRSTPTGQPPTDEDLRIVIRHGAPGTSMPAFGAQLSDAQLDELLAVIKAFAPDAFATPGTPIALAPPPAPEYERGAQLFTKWCIACHGTGRDDGPSAFALKIKPYPLAFLPLRRPRDPDDPNALRRAAATSIATGLTGTPMAGFAGALPDADIWALADHIVELNARTARRDRSALDPEQVEADRKAPIVVGTWPGADMAEVRVFGSELAPQGEPPAMLAPAQASLHAAQCGRCHAKQVREWTPSIHGAAASPGLLAQLADLSAPEIASCERCHAPLAEQRTDVALRAEGVQCAGCHLRGWERQGPAGIAASLLPLPAYPVNTLAIYERGDFCLSCHQLPPRTGVAGKPLLNTYKEWLEGPYMRRGVQCQHCHMPNREHTFLGVHDRATVRQGIELTASVHRSPDGAVTAVATLRNVGAGHYLPTTPTPAIWLGVELLDAHGALIPGASSQLRIGRDIYYDHGWHERADTRIPPGDHATLARAWTGGRTPSAVSARVTVTVHPDDYYERFYAEKLAGTPTAAQRALYEQARARAIAARYVAQQEVIPF